MRALPLLAAVLLVLSVVNADHFPPWTSFHAEAPAFAAAAVFFIAAIARGGRPRVPAAVGLLMVLLATAWMQFAAGLVTYAGDAWVPSAYLALVAAGWLWGHGEARSAGPRQVLLFTCWILAAMGLLASGQALVQWLQVGDAFPGWVFDAAVLRPSGNFGQPNLTATLLLMATASTAALLVQGKLARTAAWMLLLLFGWVVALTQSRTALLSAAMLALLPMMLGARYQALKACRPQVAVWLGLLLVAVFVVQNVQWDFSVSARKAEDMAQVGNRTLIWRQIMAGVLESPWVGHGWLQVASAQQAGSLHVPGADQVNYSHNAVLDLVVYIGIPGALLVLAIALAWLVRRLRRLRTGDAIAGAGLLILVPFFVHMQLELPHANAFLLLPAALLLGALDAATEPERGWAWQVPRAALAAVCVAWVGVLAALGYEYMLVEEDFRVNRFENRRLGSTPVDYEVPKLRLLTQWGETLHAMRLRAGPGMQAEDLDVLMRTSRRFSWGQLHFRTALSLALNGRPQEASQQLKVIKTMFHSDVYAEGRTEWIRMTREQYPQLAAVALP
jgi:O-antigen ligase